ncbi:MAG: hypothetical protein HPY60_11870 [Candidatus Methanofastidiosum sp.]|nr:hypothetical protein [Methanofastidiosum sp.]
MEDKFKIKNLLDNYYNGNTSIDEEDLLRNYLSQDNVPDEFKTDKELFSNLFIIQSDLSELNFEEDIIKAIEFANKTKSEEDKGSKIYKLFAVWAAAASVIIIIGLGFLFTSKQNEILLTDTFDDPYLAMQETKRVLSLFASKLNMAQDELEPLNRLNVPYQAMKPLGEISKNLEYLDKIESIDEPKNIPIIKEILYDDNNN